MKIRIRIRKKMIQIPKTAMLLNGADISHVKLKKFLLKYQKQPATKKNR